MLSLHFIIKNTKSTTGVVDVHYNLQGPEDSVKVQYRGRDCGSGGWHEPTTLVERLHNIKLRQSTVTLDQDNKSWITLLQEGESTAQSTKYIDVKMFWISDMTSDYFTKPLQGNGFNKMWARSMGCKKKETMSE